jgi:hypothetical protein
MGQGLYLPFAFGLRIPCSPGVLCLPDSSRSLCRCRGWQADLCSTFTSFVPYRIPSAIILALPKTSINVSKSITKVNRSIRPSMAPGNLQFIWQCHPKRKLSILSAILSQDQDGHFCSDIFFEEHAGQDPHTLRPTGTNAVFGLVGF